MAKKDTKPRKGFNEDDLFGDFDEYAPNRYGQDARMAVHHSQHEARQAKNKKSRPGKHHDSSPMRMYFKTHSSSEIFHDFLKMLNAKPLVLIVASVAAIAIGLLFSRYISVIVAVALTVVGMLASENDDCERIGYALYACALAVFIIPYLIG